MVTSNKSLVYCFITGFEVKISFFDYLENITKRVPGSKPASREQGVIADPKTEVDGIPDAS